MEQREKQMANIRKEMYEAIKEHIENYVDLTEFTDRYELEEKLHDDLWADDSVTGNASGSYYFNSWKARESVLENMEDFGEAIKEFCTEASTVGNWFINEEWEAMDVTIRCYLLGQVISEVLDDMKEELEAAFAENEE